ACRGAGRPVAATFECADAGRRLRRGRGEDDVAALEYAADPAVQAGLGGPGEAMRRATQGPAEAGVDTGAPLQGTAVLAVGIEPFRGPSHAARDDCRADHPVVGVGREDLVPEVRKSLAEGFYRRPVLGVDLVGNAKGGGEGEGDAQASRL